MGGSTVFTIKFLLSAHFALLGKIDSPFCLQNCSHVFLLIAYFAQNSARKILSRPSCGPSLWLFTNCS